MAEGDMRREIVTSDNWKELVTRVKAAGGRVRQVHNDQLALVEIPEDVDVRRLGGRPVVTSELGAMERRVVNVWEGRTDFVRRPTAPSFTDWGSAGSPLAGEEGEI